MVPQSATRLLALLIILGLTNMVYLRKLTFHAPLDRIQTSVVYNEESKSYDVQPGTPFNITCDYSNVQSNLYEVLVRWRAGSKSDEPPYIFEDGAYKRENVTVNPEEIAISSEANGTIALTEHQVPSTYYDADPHTITYVCSIYAVNGSSLSVADTILYSARIDFSVIAPAQVLNISENIRVTEGEPVALRCAASGMPKPVISWSREDGRVMEIKGGPSVLKYQSVDGMLRLADASAAMLGTYVCSATNRVTDGAVKRTTTVQVRYKPVVSVHMLVVYQMIGYHTELKCSMDQSNPPPSSSSWFYKASGAKHVDEGYGIEISTDNSRFRYTNISDDSGVMQSTLTIEPVQKKDYDRIFCCVFMNDVGHGENCISVKESAKPVLVNGQKPRLDKSTSQTGITAACFTSVPVLCLLSMLLSLGPW